MEAIILGQTSVDYHRLLRYLLLRPEAPVALVHGGMSSACVLLSKACSALRSLTRQKRDHSSGLFELCEVA